MSKIESGAQLLARLGSRPSLKGLEPAVFGSEPIPGEIVELYGEDGVGKTELLLHLVAKAILPVSWQNQDLGGCHAQVVWIDTDLKFSVTRLAVMLEGRINLALKRFGDTGCQYCKHDIHNISTNFSGRDDTWVCSDGRIKDACSTKLHNSQTVFEDSSGQGLQYFKDHESLCSSYQMEPVLNCAYEEKDNIFKTTHRQFPGDDASQNKGSPNQLDRSKTQISEISKPAENYGSIKQPVNTCPHVFSRCDAVQTDCKVHPKHPMDFHKVDIGLENVEAIVHECLQRVHVAQCTSMQQFICTLFSLDSVLSSNSAIGLIVIDSISTFFWTEKCRDLESSSLFHKNLTHIVNMLRKFSQTYSIITVVTKQALMKPKQKENDRGKGVYFPSPLQTAVRTDCENHVEFLGKMWGELVSKRYVCTKTHLPGDETQFNLTGADRQETFYITENGVQFTPSRC